MDKKWVHLCSRLGPSNVKVLVERATIPEAFLWRPATNMFTIEEAVGQMIAWPASKCVNIEHGLQTEDIETLGPRINSLNKCKLFALSSDDVVVAKGRCQTQEPKALVNGLPLGPKAVKVYVEVVHEPETFIWRPPSSMTYLEDCLMSFVAWPITKVVFENTTAATSQKSPLLHDSPSTVQSSSRKLAASTGSKSVAAVSKALIQTCPVAGTKSATTLPKSLDDKSPATCPTSPKRKNQLLSQSPRRSPRTKEPGVFKENQKCKLMNISGRKRVVAEGRIHSVDPEQKVHFVRLGPNAARVWVDIVKVDDAAVWRATDEIEYLRDAHGSSIAWPMDKLVIF